MSTTDQPAELEDRILEFYQRYLDEDLGAFASAYPSDQRVFRVPFDALFQYDADLAEDWLDQPGRFQDVFRAALDQYPLPIDPDFSSAEVALVDLPAYHTYFPGAFSPTDANGRYLAVEGEVSKASDEYSRVLTAAFRCQRCDVLTEVPQVDKDDLQEPHQCRACERDGPFQFVPEHSEMIDAQTIRLQTPPEENAGARQSIDVYLEGELADTATVGDRVTIPAQVRLEPITQGQSATAKFEPWLEGYDVTVQDPDTIELDIEPAERERIDALADGAEGDPLEVAAASLAPTIHGYEHIKRAAVLLAVGGAKVVYPNGDFDRGDFHMLLLGDPGTGKSKLVDRVESIAPRSVGVSGADATGSGITSAAVQDDFGDSEWTLEAGAFVQAHDGVVCIDELDDMDRDVRSDLLEPMSKQRIHVSKAGINATLATEAAVIAAGNPQYGRYDPYEPIADQFDLNSALISRFDLIFCPRDRPDPEEDETIANHIITARDAAKRWEQDREVTQADRETVATPVDEEILRKWVALAREQPKPVFASEDLREEVSEGFQTLRAANGYDQDAAVPVTFRKLEALVRIAEAAAAFELSETIEPRHAEIAMELVGRSMQDFQKNEDGQLDADIQETGASKPQKERRQAVQDLVCELQPESGGVAIEEVQDESELDDEIVASVIELACEEKGYAYQPENGTVRWLSKKW